jgi:F0F1-type ATP synthase assembly protein I
MGVELVVATCLGGGLGYLGDRKFSTLPWLTLLGVLMGTAAGIRNMLRIAGELEREARDEGPDGPQGPTGTGNG